MRPDFYRCAAAAKELLLQQNISSTWIDIRTLRYRKRIFFDSFENYCRVTGMDYAEVSAALPDGCTLKKDSAYIVLYHNEERKKDRLNFTLAHEIGHIYLKHQSDGDLEEIEANFFAAELLMPESVLRYLIRQNNGLRAEDLHEWFYVTRMAAEKRLQTLKRKYDLPSPQDREILRRFLPYLSVEEPPIWA